MTYLELMAAYNRMKKKLLIKSIILENLPKMDKTDQDTYFQDYRFYNPKLPLNENRYLKERMAKLLGYTGQIVTGAIWHNMLYFNRIKSGTSVTAYSPTGIPLHTGRQSTMYRLHPGYFSATKCVDKAIISKLTYPYSQVYWREYAWFLLKQEQESFSKYVASIDARHDVGKIYMTYKSVAIHEDFKEMLRNAEWLQVEFVTGGFILCPI